MANINSLKTHCKHGHEFNEENTIYATVRGKVVQRRCRECSRTASREASREFRTKDPTGYRQMFRNSQTKSKYNITWEQKQELLAKQGFKCGNPGCGNTEPGGRFDWHIDHDHSCCPEAGKSCGKCIRGLLCNSCNTALGLLKEDKARIKGLVDYLEKQNG